MKEQNSKELIKLGRILEVPGKMRKSSTFGSSYKSTISTINYEILMGRGISSFSFILLYSLPSRESGEE